MQSPKIYKAKEFNLSGLKGISDATLDMHLKLYEGYVKETNRLNEITFELAQKGEMNEEQKAAYSELKRRFSFEFNGLILHEYYFENLMKDGTGEPTERAGFSKVAETTFGSFEAWKQEFTDVGKMRGVGWAICYQEPEGGNLINEWITLHQIGHPAGYKPILVMDVWEHAFILDYKPADRPKYIEAFFSNIDWSVVEQRLNVANRAKGQDAK
jgi:superoxide dismutase, Fe-Mn family